MELSIMKIAVLLSLVLIGNVVNSTADRKSSCNGPVITNGRLLKTTRKSATGHMYKYRCRRGYRRLGNMFNICLRGRWVLDHAVCARRGCAPLPSPPGGSARQSVQRDVTSFQCQSGLQLIGDSTLHCNGRRWNGTAPICQGAGTRLWTVDAAAAGGSARLFSARLPAAAAASGCLRFWHRRRRHRRPRLRQPPGSDPIRVYALLNGTGTARVQGRLRMALRGSDGARRGPWTERTVPLPTVETALQVIIEAIRPSGRETDVTVDDVRLMHGDECGAVSPAVAPPPAARSGKSRGTSSRDPGDQHWTGLLRPSLAATNQEDAPHPAINPTPPRNPSARGQLHSNSAHRDPTGRPLIPTSALSGMDGRIQSILPRRGTGGRVREPGDAEITTGSRAVTAHPFPISSTTPRRRGHEGRSGPRAVAAGTSAFPAGRSAPPKLRGGGVEEGLMSPTGGDEKMAGKSQLNSGLMNGRGPISDSDSGGFADSLVDSGVGDARDRAGNEGGIGDTGESAREVDVACDGDDCDNGVTNPWRNLLKFISDNDSVSDGKTSEDANTYERTGGEDKIVVKFTETVKPIPTTDAADIATSGKTAVGSNIDIVDFPPFGTESGGIPSTELAPSNLPTYKMEPRNPPASTTPRGLLEERNETDVIIFPDIALSTGKGNDNQSAIDRGKLSSIVFQNPPSKPDSSSQPAAAAGAGVPFYVVIAAASGGCFLLLSTITIVILHRRKQTKAPVVAPGSVFEPEPGDRGPIAELMRQNRLDHEPIVPAPVSL